MKASRFNLTLIFNTFVLAAAFVTHLDVQQKNQFRWRSLFMQASTTADNFDQLMACRLIKSNGGGSKNVLLDESKNFFSELSRRFIKFAVFSLLLQFGSIQRIDHNNNMKSFQYNLIQVARADDELAQYAAEGHKVGVDGQCFLRKCALETTSCANDPSANCLKGLACLAR